MSKIEHIKKNLSGTTELIDNLFKPKYYEVGFNHISVDKAVVKTIHKKDGFYFEFAKMVLTSQYDVQKLFDRDNETITFTDFYNKFSFKIKDCLNFKISVSNSGFTKVSGYIKDFETNYLNEHKNSFYRAIILTEEQFYPSRYFKMSKSLQVKDAFYGSGIIDFIVNDIPLHLFSYQDEVTKKYYFIIESTSKCNYENFKNIIDEIILSITYLTGIFLGNSVIFIGSHKKSFDDIKLISIKSFFDELKDGLAVIPNFNFQREIIGNLNDFAEIKSLKCLVEEISKNLIFKRTILLICQAHTEPHYVKATLYSVALETITNLVSEILETKNKPIKNKITAKKLRTDLKAVLKNYEELISEEAFKKINEDIERINSLTNKQKLLLPFEYYKYELGPKDIDAIARRNDFLHGRIPEDLDYQDLAITVGRLLFCVNVLVLKYIGFKGCIFYPAAMYQYNNKLKTDDDLLKII